MSSKPASNSWFYSLLSNAFSQKQDMINSASSPSTSEDSWTTATSSPAQPSSPGIDPSTVQRRLYQESMQHEPVNSQEPGTVLHTPPSSPNQPARYPCSSSTALPLYDWQPPTVPPAQSYAIQAAWHSDDQLTTQREQILTLLKSVNYCWHAFPLHHPNLAHVYCTGQHHRHLINTVSEVNDHLAPDEFPLAYPVWPAQYLYDLTKDLDIPLNLLTSGERACLTTQLARDLAITEPGLASEEAVLRRLIGKTAEVVKTARMKVEGLELLRECARARVAVMGMENERKGRRCDCGCSWHEN